MQLTRLEKTADATHPFGKKQKQRMEPTRLEQTYSTLLLESFYHILCDLCRSRHFSLTGGCSSPVWNTACRIWNGQVETDALRRFNRTAMPIHYTFWDQVRTVPLINPTTGTVRVTGP